MANSDLLTRLSKRVPESFTVETLALFDICKSTEKFFDENFRGAVLVSCDECPESFVSASATGVAYFYRLLLEHIFGESVLYVKMQTNGYKFVIQNEFSIKRKLEEETKFKLENVARLSGFDIFFTSRDDNTLIDIVFNMRPTQAIPIYARSVRLLELAYVNVFFY